LKGLVFEKKSLKSLIKCIEMLANDKALWSKIALQSQKAAYDYATTYTPNLYLEKHEEIYRKACQSV